MAFIYTNFKLDDLKPGAGVGLQLESEYISLFRTTEGVFALNSLCPHRGAMLTEGFITDDYVTCPWHQWQFQLKDGVCKNIPGAQVATYPVEVREGKIWVDPEKKGQE